MAKEVSGLIKLQIKGGAANPAPPVGPYTGSGWQGFARHHHCLQGQVFRFHREGFARGGVHH